MVAAEGAGISEQQLFDVLLCTDGRLRSQMTWPSEHARQTGSEVQDLVCLQSTTVTGGQGRAQIRGGSLWHGCVPCICQHYYRSGFRAALSCQISKKTNTPAENGSLQHAPYLYIK